MRMRIHAFHMRRRMHVTCMRMRIHVTCVHRQTSCTTEEEDAFHLHLEAHMYALAQEIPDNSLVMGTPGKVVKLLTPEQVSH